ncbi:S-layer homology domain-containing protein [Cohnella suwonensis]|uniref:S-layer homology domain-containing protein n=1 Tax=Cohnella suwonensis TaxID=696072 RepID=A0ABW0LSX0_9BACL
MNFKRKKLWVLMLAMVVAIGGMPGLFVHGGSHAYAAAGNWETVGNAGFSAGQADFTSLYVYDGTPYVAYRDYGNSNKATVMKKNGSSWETVGSAGFSAGQADFTSLTVYDGTPYVAYKDGANSGQATVMKYDGSSWVTVGNAGFSAGAAFSVSQAVYGGTPYVAYADYGNSGKATVMKYNGSSWETVGNAGFSVDVADFTSLYIYNGTPYVAYKDSGNADKATVMKYNGSSWETVGNAGFSAGVADYTSLFVDDGTPYVAYEDGANSNKGTVMKYNGSTWETVGSEGFTSGGVDYTSLYVYDGTPYVAYRDGFSTNATVQKYNGSWETVGSAGFSSGSVMYTSLYVHNGTPYVAYADGGNSNKATVMAPMYTVTFDGNGALSGTVPAGSSGFVQNANVTVLDNTGSLAKTDHTFAGWNTAADGSGMDYNAGDTFTMGTNDVTLYAQWTVSSYSRTVTYDVNGAVSGSVPTPSAYAYDSRVTVLGNTGNLVKPGYLFAGWNTAADGSGTYYAEADTFTIGAADITLYAQWTESTETVKTWRKVGSAGFSAGETSYTSLYVDKGTPYVAYRDYGNSDKATVKKYNGSGWETVGNAGFSAGQADFTSLTVFGGTPYVAYKDGANSDKATVMKYNGSGWETVGSAGFSAGAAFSVSQAVYGGTPYVAYADYGNSGKATVMKYNGSSWETVGSAGFSAGVADYTSLYIFDGTPYVAYRDSGYADKATVKKYNGSSWETVGSEGISAGTADYISLYVYDGTPYVGYKDWQNSDKATVKKYNGSSWETVGSEGFSAGKADYISLYVYDGTPYVAYKDFGKSDKATVMKYNGSGWETVGDSGFSASAANYISLNVYDGDSYVAYVDGGNSNKATMMKWLDKSTVAYDGNGATSGNAPANRNYNQNASVMVLGNTGNLIKAGYTFAGWNTSADGSGTRYAAGDTFVMGADNFTLYAQWRSNNALLSNLSVDQGTLSPSFTPSNLNYNVDLDYAVSSLNVSFVQADPAQTLSVTGAVYQTVTGAIYTYRASGLIVGANPIRIGVTAQDGTENVYTVTVNRASSSSSGSSGGGGGLSPITSKDGKITLPAGRIGEVSLDKAIVISIPTGVSSKQLDLTIEIVSNTQSVMSNGEILSSPVYELLKNFSENFSKPVTLTLSFDQAKVKSGQTVAIFYYDEVKKLWVKVEGGKINGNRISAEVDHFTKFAVLVVDGKTGLAVTEETPTKETTDAAFRDIAGHWAEASIKQAVESRIASGYPDGTFKPNRTVTRAEFAVMLVNALKLQSEEAQLTFADAANIGAWAKKAVALAVKAGILKGYADGSFRPDAEITRAEMAAMIANALGHSADAQTTTGYSDDKDIPAWARAGVAYAKQSGIAQGKGDNRFAPQDRATRAEAVAVLLKAAAAAK